jgi:phosphoribosylamine--glycine ligase
VKADGLAAGKGVVVCRTQEDVDRALSELAALGSPLLIEELLEGPEISLFAVCDGRTAVALPPAQDFKRAYDGDEGPNTGGMGSYAPVPGVGDDEVTALLERVHLPVLSELEQRGTPFVGLLYAGLMLTSEGPKVLEFNCRFGDPETQSVLPILEGDLLELLAAAATGDLAGIRSPGAGGAAVTVVVSAGSYPAAGDRGTPIRGIEAAEGLGALVFHAGTAVRGEELVTNGGRILGVTVLGETVADARERAYAAVGAIEIEGSRYRRDIAEAAASGWTASLEL